MFEKIKWFIAATRVALSCENNAQTLCTDSSDFDPCPLTTRDEPGRRRQPGLVSASQAAAYSIIEQECASTQPHKHKRGG